MKFVLVGLKRVHDSVIVLQKESGGIVDIMDLFDQLKTGFQEIAKGHFPAEVQKTFAMSSAAQANILRKEFMTAGTVFLSLFV